MRIFVVVASLRFLNLLQILDPTRPQLYYKKIEPICLSELRKNRWDQIFWVENQKKFCRVRGGDGFSFVRCMSSCSWHGNRSPHLAWSKETILERADF